MRTDNKQDHRTQSGHERGNNFDAHRSPFNVQRSRRRQGVWCVMLFTLLSLASPVGAAGIPEPGLTLYGLIRNDIGGATVRMTSGTLHWTIVPPSGPPVSVQTELVNVNGQFSYVINIPFETPLAGVAATSNALQMRVTSQTFKRAQVYVGTSLATIVPPAGTNFQFSAVDRAKVERVDLVVSVQEPDADGDGLPDSWEARYFSGYADPDLDDDGDGVSNLREYLAGTDPTDAQSVLEFVQVTCGADGSPAVTWSSQPGRYYRIMRSGALLTGFVPLATGISATPPFNVFKDTSATNQVAFYKVELE